MKHKTAFRLALRLLAVYLLVTAIPGILETFAYEYRYGGDGTATWCYATADALRITLALWLWSHGSRVIANWAIRSNRPYCHECGYELTGSPPCGACPECGTAYARAT